jgi:putative peptidoglycan lipid II flippase
VAPGFPAADRALFVMLFRIMLLSPIIFAVSSTIGSILQSLERFVAYSLAPIVYNVGIIFGAWYLVPLMRSWGYQPVLGLALGVVFGALLHLVIQLPSVYAAGFRFRAVFNTHNTGFRRIVWLMAPRSLALGAYQISLTVINAIASMLGAGSITILNLATNLQYLPVSIIGISVATAVFPRLSSHASAQEKEHFKKKFTQAMAYTFWGVLVAAVGIYVFRSFIVRVYVGSGAFGQDDIARTAMVVGIFMLGVIPQSLVHVMARAFYALQDTRTPFWTSLTGIVTTIGLSVYAVFILHWGIAGLALASSLGMYVYGTLSYVLLRRRL